MDAATPTVAGRSCSGCTMCCKVMGITELSKPPQQWCSNCDVGVGCKIYDRKPQECADFHCLYLLDPRLGEEWKPSTSHLVMNFEPHANRIIVRVDVGRTSAWRREPYYSVIRNWGVMALQNDGQVLVIEGHDTIAVLPDRDKNLGRVRDDQVMVTAVRSGIAGDNYDILVLDRDDPRLAGMTLPIESDPRTKWG